MNGFDNFNGAFCNLHFLLFLFFFLIRLCFAVHFSSFLFLLLFCLIHFLSPSLSFYHFLVLSISLSFIFLLFIFLNLFSLHSLPCALRFTFLSSVLLSFLFIPSFFLSYLIRSDFIYFSPSFLYSSLSHFGLFLPRSIFLSFSRFVYANLSAVLF